MTGQPPSICNQCWKPKPRDGLKNHRRCRVAAKARGKALRAGAKFRRRSLRDADHRGVLWIPSSCNRKLGPIPASIVAAGTCPPSCAFWGHGCYAESGIMGFHWARVGGSETWDSMCRSVILLPEGQLWRHAVAGDLPGAGERLDVRRLRRLLAAAAHTRGFTFTHKKLKRREEEAVVRDANRRAATARRGFVINLSANSPAHADELAAKGIGPVATALPYCEQPPALMTTPGGRVIVVCPAQRRKDVTCAKCGLCAKAWRKSIIGFVAHGQGKRLVSDVATGRRLAVLNSKETQGA